ncbi:TBCE-like protein [Mya arenaria]|uniref:Tubulin-specific chaperone E n=1 Tax=Mya arenaria TaxID=6604 RepID=A0ABY7FH29_MYAAR|nr:TBCE-like protein [Mya arenaria]
MSTGAEGSDKHLPAPDYPLMVDKTALPLTDSWAVNIALQDSITVTMGLYDTRAVNIALHSSMTVTMGLYDTRAVNIALHSSMTVTMGLYDTRAVNIALHSSMTVTTGLYDTRAVNIALHSSMTVTTGLYDTRAVNIALHSSMTVAMGFYDTRAVNIALHSSMTVTMGLYDTRAVNIALHSSMTVAMGFYDTRAVNIALHSSMTVTMGLYDTRAVNIALHSSMTVTMGLYDTRAVNIALHSSMTVTTGLYDTRAVNIALHSSMTVTTGLYDTRAVNIALHSSMTVAMGFYDTRAVNIALHSSMTVTTGLYDTRAVNIALHSSMTVTMGLYDTRAVNIALHSSMTVAMGLYDTRAVNIALHSSMTVTMGLYDTRAVNIALHSSMTVTICSVGKSKMTEGLHTVDGVPVGIGDRLECDGVWLGVEWDDPERGKHNGTHEGHTFFTTRHPKSGSFIRPKKANFGVSFMSAVCDRYGRIEDENAGVITDDLYVVGGKNQQTVVEMVGARKVNDLQGGNVLEIPDRPGDLLENFSRITAVFLNRMGYDWSEVLKCSEMFPRLEQLHVCFNGISTLSVLNGHLQNVQLVNLESNNLQDWEQLLYLGHLPQIKSNPLMESATEQTVRQLLIAKLKHLKMCNRTEVANDERKGAEIDYLKRFGPEWVKSGGHQDLNVSKPSQEFVKQHPRYADLNADQNLEYELDNDQSFLSFFAIEQGDTIIVKL